MDKARQRVASNLAILKARNPELGVLGDQRWVNDCTNQYIQHMAKKIWMHELTDLEIEQVDKAVTGYLTMLRRRAEAGPVTPGGRIVKGEIFSVKKTCDHDACYSHWRMNVRDTEEKNTIYTPILPDILGLVDSPKDLVGCTVSFYAFVTVSTRDETFGFAHRPKLMTIQREGTNASQAS